MTYEQELRTRRLILFAVAAIIGGTALAWGLFLVRDALQVVYLSAILSLGANPVIRWLEHRRLGKRHLPRWLAILVLYAVLLAMFVLTLDIVVPPLASQASDLGAHLPEYNDRIQRWLISHHILRKPFTIAELVERGPNPNATVTGILGAVNLAVGALLTTFTLLLLSFYLLVDGEDLFFGFLRWLPSDSRDRWRRMAKDAGAKVGAWMAGQFVLCLLIGTTSAIGFWIIGLPYFYVLALICGLGELIPLIGPVIAAAPAVLVGATVGVNTALIVTVYLFVQQQLNANIIIPRLMQKQTGISPIIIMVAILIGGSLLGVLGALLAVPTAAVVQILVREYLNYRDES